MDPATFKVQQTQNTPSTPTLPSSQGVPVSFIYGESDWMDPRNAVALSEELDRVRPRAVGACWVGCRLQPAETPPNLSAPPFAPWSVAHACTHAPRAQARTPLLHLSAALRCRQITQSRSSPTPATTSSSSSRSSSTPHCCGCSRPGSAAAAAAARAERRPAARERGGCCVAASGITAGRRAGAPHPKQPASGQSVGAAAAGQLYLYHIRACPKRQTSPAPLKRWLGLTIWRPYLLLARSPHKRWCCKTLRLRCFTSRVCCRFGILPFSQLRHGPWAPAADAWCRAGRQGRTSGAAPRAPHGGSGRARSVSAAHRAAPARLRCGNAVNSACQRQSLSAMKCTRPSGSIGR